MIYGETGPGRAAGARDHELSARKQARREAELRAIPTGLLESEMFGHERGAFTGAIAQRIGRFDWRIAAPCS